MLGQRGARRGGTPARAGAAPTSGAQAVPGARHVPHYAGHHALPGNICGQSTRHDAQRNITPQDITEISKDTYLVYIMLIAVAPTYGVKKSFLFEKIFSLP